ncbi:RNA-binding protein [Jeotgalibacillus haloalkalitolerans]|uniref:RNA-binding protein n=1 Tax=Jeotgalibacillus haloalkalitolerans TaxID=3104292 RepID=A0ABU5KKW9_9BACL|nr:RNA-binding protein [Jeotgalibacillus sp. HH7-29]MDZ5711581.1 RNA-binding protein [Jeotgalibacillus sp. HH7-29]
MSVYQHFRDEEKGFIDQVLDWKQDVELKYAPRLTAFLDPRQQHIMQSIIGSAADIKVAFEGGAEDSERKRALLYPDYLEPVKDDFELALLDVGFPSKFVQLTHGDILGSLMGLGIKREALGDILTSRDRIQLISTKEMKDFLIMNLVQAGKAKVQVTEEKWESIIEPENKWTEKNVLVSSMRLDTVLAGAVNISRQKAQLLIQGGKVKVNFRQEEKTSFELDQGDMISVRGYGRMRVGEQSGITKKDKIRLNFYFLQS